MGIDAGVGGGMCGDRFAGEGDSRLCCSLIDEDDGVCCKGLGLLGTDVGLCGIEYGEFNIG